MSVFKAHSKPISGVFYNSEATFLITVSDDKNLFIFRTSCTKSSERSISGKDLKIVPAGFVTMSSLVIDVVFQETTSKDCVSIIVLYKNGTTESLLINLLDWTSDDSYEISKNSIKATRFTLLNVPELDASFAEVAKSMERLNMKAAPKLKIDKSSSITQHIKVDSDFSLVAVINSDNETEIRLIQLSSNNSSM